MCGEGTATPHSWTILRGQECECRSLSACIFIIITRVFSNQFQYNFRTIFFYVVTIILKIVSHRHSGILNHHRYYFEYFSLFCIFLHASFERVFSRASQVSSLAFFEEYFKHFLLILFSFFDKIDRQLTSARESGDLQGVGAQTLLCVV